MYPRSLAAEKYKAARRVARRASETLEMQIGLDGLPLTAAKTGVGHYTYELARALACTEPSSQFEIVYPSTYATLRPDKTKSALLPPNLQLNRVKVGPLARYCWSAGLPRYVRRSKLQLFHS